MIYVLFSGHVPFHSSTGGMSENMAHRIKSGKFDFCAPKWANVSQQAKDFILQMIQVDPETRPTIFQIAKSEWLKVIDILYIYYFLKNIIYFEK